MKTKTILTAGCLILATVCTQAQQTTEPKREKAVVETQGDSIIILRGKGDMRIRLYEQQTEDDEQKEVEIFEGVYLEKVDADSRTFLDALPFIPKKKLDGSWEFGYAAFDKWVEFMTEDIGLKGLISCYTIIPWALNFDYYDEATNRVLFLQTKPGDAAYAEYWGTFLKDFARHLREKGWFERTAISMDERPMEAMREAIKVVRAADPEFKITLAGNYHPEIEPDLYYYCIALGQKFPADVKKAREAKGQISTYYTCCAEAFPNTFTFSRPAEAVWTMVHAVAEGYDGYLRWSFNSWTADPLRDSRFRTWAAGDTYSVYPGPRSSIRFERMTEGVQECEKIRILREEFTRKGDKGKLSRLDKILSKFTLEALPEGRNHPEKDVADLHEALNAL